MQSVAKVQFGATEETSWLLSHRPETCCVSEIWMIGRSKWDVTDCALSISYRTSHPRVAGVSCGGDQGSVWLVPSRVQCCLAGQIDPFDPDWSRDLNLLPNSLDLT